MAVKRASFSEDAANRIASAVRRVEAQPVLPGGPGPGGPRLWNPGVLDAVVTTAIPAGTTSTYSTTGYAQIKIDDGSGNKVNDTAYPDPVQVLNGYLNSGTIAIGTYIKVHWRNGKFVLLGADC